MMTTHVLMCSKKNQKADGARPDGSGAHISFDDKEAFADVGRW